jgi:3-dehydroquinate dehydratase-2
MKLLVINGPNINLLGIREKNIYGGGTYKELLAYITGVCAERRIEADLFQSNHEGAIVDKIQDALGRYDGIVINPAAYTHTSVAIADALKAVSIPAVEVHISDVDNREDFRKISYVRPVCVATFSGHGFEGYKMAVETLCKTEKNSV